MKQWIMGVVCVALLSILTEVLLSEGKMKKYIGGFVRLALVFAIISPVIGYYTHGEVTIDAFEVSTDAIVDSTYVQSMTRRRFDLAERTIEKELSTENREAHVRIDLYFDGTDTIVYLVEVRIDNIGINENMENTISTEEVKRTVSNHVNVREENIIVYGLDQSKTEDPDRKDQE
ncbi:MAG: stage III sporulation protein AF [Clostridia bacterium]|nr:stage III sporulation protein AF [Clostridia bacterium]